MCGIAGIIDLAGRRRAPAGILSRMANTLFHRGPDDDGYFESDGVAMANRRLSIIGLADGKQPLHNENKTVHVVMNGELFDYIEQRDLLKSQGHSFRTSTDTEIVPHLYEQHGNNFLDHVRGQFAIALYDEKNRTLTLARDRIGIVPLFFTTVRDGGGEWFLFASEIKALFASGMVKAQVDHAGVNGIFVYFAMPGPRTCFAGITSLPPGHSLTIPLNPNTRGDQLQPRPYWKLDFPDRGQELDGPEDKIVDRYEELLFAATKRRLRADVPVVSYLSGGIDSSQVVAMAVKALGRPLPTFTIGVKAEGLNEEHEARLVARHAGCEQVVVPFDGQDVMKGYPELVHTAEMPVMDTACAAMVALAKSVHANGYKVALTGEGSDEFLAGYPWFKLNKVLSSIDIVPGLWLSQRLRRGMLRLAGLPRYPWPDLMRACNAVGGYGPWLDAYGLMALSRLMFFSDGMRDTIGKANPYEELGFDLERMAKWHPFHRGMALGIRVMLPGMLLLCKGDRVAMHSSVETRYPFLDDELLAYTCQLHPRWKLRRLTDKYIVRKVGERWLPRSIARRRKLMFRAPMDCFHLDDKAPPFINQLLSEESLKRTGYFDANAVRAWRERLPHMWKIGYARTAVEMGLVAVTATQLWHQTFIDSTLADVPTPTVERSALIGQSASANGYHDSRVPSHEPRTP